MIKVTTTKALKTAEILGCMCGEPGYVVIYKEGRTYIAFTKVYKGVQVTGLYGKEIAKSKTLDGLIEDFNNIETFKGRIY